MFDEYSTEQYDDLNNQHNIMALVGNGFDMGLLYHLRKYGFLPVDNSRPQSTGYNDFFKYIEKNDAVKDNRLFQEMVSQKKREEAV